MKKVKAGAPVVVTFHEGSPATCGSRRSSLPVGKKTRLRGHAIKEYELGWLVMWEDGHRMTWEDRENIEMRP